MPDGSFLTIQPELDALAAFDHAGLAEPPPEQPMPSLARKGRGAVTNPASRYDHQVAAPIDDGWSFLTGEELTLPPVQTVLERGRWRRRASCSRRTRSARSR